MTVLPYTHYLINIGVFVRVAFGVFEVVDLLFDGLEGGQLDILHSAHLHPLGELRVGELLVTDKLQPKHSLLAAVSETRRGKITQLL